MKKSYLTLSIIMIGSIALQACSTLSTPAMSFDEVVKMGSDCKQAGLEFKVFSSHTLPSTMIPLSENDKAAYLKSVRGSLAVYDAWCAAPDKYNYSSKYAWWEGFKEELKHEELIAQVDNCRSKVPVTQRSNLENYAEFVVHPVSASITEVICKGNEQIAGESPVLTSELVANSVQH
ncbi:MAG TPA: hypothetical protein ENI67_05030 [Gammaproteobacteria bacterium]|nr:hypothetical protein [Gammaproteobacteria bacterium]